jgi:two-component system response regulator AtoC
VLQEASRAKDVAEAEAILDALHRSQWNRKQAAALLNIEYKALLYKMKKLSIGDRAGKISRPA